jgi:hypothetical protein
MVITMTQSREGWLWLGSNNGLFRFDGVHFERYADPDQPLPAAAIATLNAFDDGSLWIGYRYGGVSVLTQGRLRNYNERDGLPASTVRVGAGTRWLRPHVGRHRARACSIWTANAGPPPARISRCLSSWYKTLMRDRYGALWAQGNEGVYKLPPGAASASSRRRRTAAPACCSRSPTAASGAGTQPRSRLRRLTPACRRRRPAKLGHRRRCVQPAVRQCRVICGSVG